MSSTLRIGAVAYLNSKPLIHELHSQVPDAELILDVPSRLADDLAEGRLDVALIPVIEYFRSGKYTMLPNICVSSRGPVLSVTLFSRVPWPEIRSIALDEGSRTSAALTQVLARRRHEIAPKLLPFPLDCAAEKVDADAVLMIGDRAMRACLPGMPHAYDLGQEWFDWTGLPFVYAVWAAREGAELGGLGEALLEVKRRGRAAVGEIAHSQAPLLGLDAGFCRRYLDNIIHFDLGSRELAGLHHFYMLAAELGLAKRGVTIEFHHQPDLAQSC